MQVLESNYRESQHKRIVAISVAAIVFGLFAILRLASNLVGNTSLAYFPGTGSEWYLLSACILMVCTVAVILARSIEDNFRGRYLDLHEPLTGLPNRDNTLHKLSTTWKISMGRGVLMLVNLHRLGSINVSLGRDAGDAVVKVCAERLRYLFDAPHFVGTVSSGVFAIYIDGVTDREAICQISEKLDKALSLPIEVADRVLFISKSTGAVIYFASDGNAEEALRRAELALLEARARESKAPVIFNRDLEQAYSNKGSLENDFPEALANRQVEPWLQPLMEADGKTLRGFEALARWRHPTRGMISPVVFVPVAEKLNMADQLGRLILRRACQLVKPYDGLMVSVNVTATHLLQPDFVDQVRLVLLETGMPAGRLELEITETVVLEQTDIASERIETLRAMGVLVALDDFGTGYSGLSYLNRFQVDRIKIDRSFVSEVENSSAARETIESVISLARKRGCNVTAEGVETRRQFEFLQNFGHLTYQGYWFSQPIAPDDLATHRIVQDFNLQRFKEETKLATSTFTEYGASDSAANA